MMLKADHNLEAILDAHVLLNPLNRGPARMRFIGRFRSPAGDSPWAEANPQLIREKFGNEASHNKTEPIGALVY